MKKISLDVMGEKTKRSTIALLAVLALTGGLYANGLSRNYFLTKYSATTKGSMSQFKRSRGEATIKNYFTDESQDVLVVTIGIKEQTQTPLPYVATDYVVAVDSKGYKEDVPVFFGRMSTDGDLFLIIPKPKQAIYDIIIANRGYINYSNAGQASERLNTLDLDKESLTKIISDSQVFREAGEEGTKTTDQQSDSIRFRVGIKTAINDERYKPSVLPVKSLLIEKGDTVAFDFETFWTMVYKQPLIDTVTREIEVVTDRVGELRGSAITLQERLNVNSKDETAQTELSKVQAAIAIEEDELLRLTETLDKYNELTYNPADFSNYSTKMFSLKF